MTSFTNLLCNSKKKNTVSFCCQISCFSTLGAAVGLAIFGQKHKRCFLQALLIFKPFPVFPLQQTPAFGRYWKTETPNWVWRKVQLPKRGGAPRWQLQFLSAFHEETLLFWEVIFQQITLCGTADSFCKITGVYLQEWLLPSLIPKLSSNPSYPVTGLCSP